MAPDSLDIPGVSRALTEAIRICPAPTAPLFADLNAALVAILAPLTAAARTSSTAHPSWQSTLVLIQRFADAIIDTLTPLNFNNTEAWEAHVQKFITDAKALNKNLDSKGLYTAFVPSFAQQRLWEKIAVLLAGDDHEKFFGPDGEKLRHIFINLDIFYSAIEALLRAPCTVKGISNALVRLADSQATKDNSLALETLSPGKIQAPIKITRFIQLRRSINNFLNGRKLAALPIEEGRTIVKLCHLLWCGGDLSVEPDDVDPEKEYIKKILEFELDGSDIGFPTTIGASSYSVVYEATFKVPDDDWAQVLWRSRVAVKMFLPYSISVDREPYFRQASLRVGTFSHPSLLLVHMTNWPQGVTPELMPGERCVKDVFVVSEFMTHNLRTARHLPALASPRTRLRILSDVASALSYLHRMGIAHMSIMPENIFVRVYSDELYGPAKVDVTNLFKHALFPSWTETYMNKQWLYRPPERVGEGNVFFTADSWSFGVLACYLMSEGADREENFYTSMKATKSQRKAVKEWCSTLANATLRTFILECLRENPEDRLVMTEIFDRVQCLLESMFTDDADPITPSRRVQNGTSIVDEEEQEKVMQAHGMSGINMDLHDSSSDCDAVMDSADDIGHARNGSSLRQNGHSILGNKRKRSSTMNWSATSGRANAANGGIASSSTRSAADRGRDAKRARSRKAINVSKDSKRGSQSGSRNAQPGVEVHEADVTSVAQDSRTIRRSFRRTLSNRRTQSESISIGHRRNSAGRSVTGKRLNDGRMSSSSGSWSDDEFAILIERKGPGRPRGDAQQVQKLQSDTQPPPQAQQETPQRPDGPALLPLRRSESPTPSERAKAGDTNQEAELLLESGKPGCITQAAKLFKKAADCGHARAQVNYGHCLELGRGVRQDFGEAAYYFQVAAEQGDPSGQLKIGLCHEFGRGTKKDDKVAFKWYSKSAEQGNAQAQLNLGIAYQNGRGVKADHVKAAELYRNAAQSGDLAVAKLNLGVLYEEGKGVPVDFSKAYKLYEEAAKGGSHEALLNLAYCHQRGRGCELNLSRAAVMFIRAADHGNKVAKYRAGQCYELGEGVAINFTKAAHYYRQAAEADSLKAMYNLGRFYLKGIGVEKAPNKAFKLFEAASTNGHVPSTVMLGWCYDNAKGVRESSDKAVQNYKKAAAAGNPRAKVYLGYKYELGRGVKTNKSTAVRLYRESAAAGCPKGETALGQCYQFGYGMNKCITTAVTYYEKAVEKGDDGACEELGKILRDGAEVDQDEARAVECFKKGAEAGNVNCMVYYGELLFYGRGIAKDQSAAVEQFQKAADLGGAEGYRWLGDCYSEGGGVDVNLKKAAECYMEGGKLGSSVAQTSLGVSYEHGHGVPVNGTKALEMYRRAASSGGNFTAMNNLGILYEKGKFVKKDFQRAFKFYQKAWDGGNVDSICNLADCYANGHGVQRDMAKALQLYQEASDLGQAGAQCELGACYYFGRGVQPDYPKAVDLFCKAMRSEPEAARHLGVAYFDGNGVSQSFEKALELFMKAVSEGNHDAYLNLGLCYEFGHGVDKNMEQAARCYRQAMDSGNKTAARCLGKLYILGCGVEKNVGEAYRLFRENPLAVDQIMS